MITNIKKQLAMRRLKNQLQAYARADKNFLRATRESFVELTKLRSTSSHRPVHSPAWRYATVAMVALISLTSGMAVFAEKGDVPATHPLYQLKRLSEQVQLVVSSPEKKLEIHENLVERRLKEIAELKTETAEGEPRQELEPKVSVAVESVQEDRIELKTMNTASKEVVASKSVEVRDRLKERKIKELNSDFQKEAEAVLDQAEKLPIEKSAQVRICKEIINNINKGPASKSSRFLERIQTRCDEVYKERE